MFFDFVGQNYITTHYYETMYFMFECIYEN